MSKVFSLLSYSGLENLSWSLPPRISFIPFLISSSVLSDCGNASLKSSIIWTVDCSACSRKSEVSNLISPPTFKPSFKVFIIPDDSSPLWILLLKSCKKSKTPFPSLIFKLIPNLLAMCLNIEFILSIVDSLYVIEPFATPSTNIAIASSACPASSNLLYSFNLCLNLLFLISLGSVLAKCLINVLPKATAISGCLSNVFLKKWCKNSWPVTFSPPVATAASMFNTIVDFSFNPPLILSIFFCFNLISFSNSFFSFLAFFICSFDEFSLLITSFNLSTLVSISVISLSTTSTCSFVSFTFEAII